MKDVCLNFVLWFCLIFGIINIFSAGYVSHIICNYLSMPLPYSWQNFIVWLYAPNLIVTSVGMAILMIIPNNILIDKKYYDEM